MKAKHEKMLGLLGMCRKAGRLAVGELPAGEACRADKAKLLVLAADAAGNTIKKAKKYSQMGNVPIEVLPCSKEELGGALGRNVCALAAVTDKGLAEAIQKSLAEFSV